MTKIIASFATVPSRIAMLEPVIDSILAQTTPADEIHIQIPEFCIKENSHYAIPDFLKHHPKVTIKQHKDDYGSSNKWLYPIQYLKHEENTLLFILDDDCKLQPKTFHRLHQRMEEKHTTSFCFTGGILPKKGKVNRFTTAETPIKHSLTIIENNTNDIPVDTMQGFSTYGLHPSWFLNFDFDSFIKNLPFRTLSDDILISGILESLSVSRIQIGPYQLPDTLYQSEINPIHGTGKLTNMTINSLISIQQKLGVWPYIKPQNPTKLTRTLRKIKRKITRKIYF